MKNFLSLATLIGFSFYSPVSFAGGVTSNGGDSIAAEFTVIARQIAEILRTHPDSPVKADQFLKGIAKTWVVSKKRTLLKGQEMDAVNFPKSRRIEVNRRRWLANRNQMRRRYVLVAHEYFGILGIPDQRYQVSEKLFDLPGAATHTIRCQAFSDGILKFGAASPSNAASSSNAASLSNGGNFYLELNAYRNQAIALVKDDEGVPIPFSSIGVGDTMVVGTLSDAPLPKVVIPIHLGFSVRMVQVTVGGSANGKIMGKRWDVGADAQVTPIVDVECAQTNW